MTQGSMATFRRCGYAGSRRYAFRRGDLEMETMTNLSDKKFFLNEPEDDRNTLPHPNVAILTQPSLQ